MTGQSRSISAGGIILGPDGKIVIVSQHGNSWSLPKGTLEPGEDNITAAKREIEEETGLTELTLIQELGTYKRYRIGLGGGDDRSHIKVITIYLYTTHQSELQPHDSDNPEARWVEIERVEAMLTHPKDKEFFKSVKHKVLKTQAI